MKHLEPKISDSLMDVFEVAGGVVPVIDEGTPEVQKVIGVDLVNSPLGHCLESDIEAVFFKDHLDREVYSALEDG